MARAHDRVLDAVAGGDSQRAWKEMDHHFTLNERIARRIAKRGSSPVPHPGTVPSPEASDQARRKWRTGSRAGFQHEARHPVTVYLP
jgi:hypothetical protein